MRPKVAVIKEKAAQIPRKPAKLPWMWTPKTSRAKAKRTNKINAAINAALRRDAEGDDGQTAPTLALIVNKLITRAPGGDMSAIKEILDRMDGKTAAGATEDEGPRRVIVRWKD